MKSSDLLQKSGLLTTVVLQIILLFIGFYKAFIQANDYMFLSIYDGFKNYFTFQGYLSQPKGDLSKFTQMNYPYGEYIFYTDNSPAIALPFKLISDHIINLSGFGIPIYNFIIIGGYLLTTIFTYLILKKYLKNEWLIILFSLAFSWLHPQMLRPFVGHLNLGWAWVLLLTLYATHQITFATTKKQTQKWLILLTFALIWTAFVHLYYFLMNVLFLGFWGVAWAIDCYFKKENWWLPLLKSIVPSVIALMSTMVLIRWVDSDYTHRLAAQGYNFENWRLSFYALYHSYPFDTIAFPFKATKVVQYESYAYLGSAALLALVLFIILSFLRLIKRLNLPTALFSTLRTGNNRLLYYWLFAAIMMSFIALGNTIFGGNNYLSLFFYISKWTDMVTHFRCLGRFSWFLFWVVNFIVALWIDRIFSQSDKRFFKIIASILILFLIFDTKDFVLHINQLGQQNSLTKADNFSEIRSIAKRINRTEYQSILPIPYFHAGSEDYNYTIDAPEAWLNNCGQFQHASGLPLMASQMSRTAIYQPQALFSIFTEERPAQDLLDKLNDKPILVLYSKIWNAADNSWCGNEREPAKTVAYSRKNIIKKYNMKLILETDNFLIYRWSVKDLQ